jgi:hypothetical protein
MRMTRSLMKGSVATRLFGRVAVLLLVAAAVGTSFSVAYAAKKPKHPKSTHTERTAPSAGGMQQAPSGPPDPGSYK